MGDQGGTPIPSSRYSFLKNISRGSYGQVVLAQEIATGRQVAVKKLQRGSLTNSRILKYVEDELVHMRLLVHPHIPRFIEVFASPSNLNCVMEYAAGGNLLEYVSRHGRLDEPTARRIFQQLISAVDYIHNKGICNRDIKLENILLQEPEPAAPWVKLCDFGFSKSMEEVTKTAVGTVAYMAPEVLKNLVTQKAEQYNAKSVDVWSCGIVLYAMLAGRMPFQGEPRQLMSLFEELKVQPVTAPAELGLTPECVDLLQKLLQPESVRRITIQKITEHDWYLDCRQSEEWVRTQVRSSVPTAAVTVSR